MGWIKRNLFFVIGGGIALVLLGGAGFYIYQGWSRNSQAADDLNQNYSTLKQLADKNPGPGANNTAIAKDQEKQILDWIQSAGNYFQPIPAIPPGAVTSETFASALRRTVAQLSKEAQSASVALPLQYEFSFGAQRLQMQFAASSLPSLAVQLGEVKAIAEIMFSAGVNSLDGIQRVRVSDEDANGSQADYTADVAVTNDFTVITPYVVTFRSFTPEIARVICAFANSSNEFIIHSIDVGPAGQGANLDESQPGMAPPEAMPGQYPGQYPGGFPPRMGGFPGGYPGGYPPMGNTPVQAPPTPGRGGLQTVLKEQLLQITLKVELVKLLPKS